MLITSHICKTMDIGVNGNLFGGRMMAWLDEAGVIFAQFETGKKNFVTKSFDSIEFKLPVKVKDTVYINASVKEKRSKGVSVELSAICNSQLVCRTIGIFIHVDENGVPANLIPEETLSSFNLVQSNHIVSEDLFYGIEYQLSQRRAAIYKVGYNWRPVFITTTLQRNIEPSDMRLSSVINRLLASGQKVYKFNTSEELVNWVYKR